MAGEFSPTIKDVACRGEKICVKFIYFIKRNMITSFFYKVLFKFFRNNIKHVVLNALSSSLKDALLRVVTI